MAQEEKKLTLKMVMWVIGIMASIWACAYAYTWSRLSVAEAKTDKVSNKYEEVNSQLSNIQANVEWIKDTMKGTYNN